MAVAAIRSEPGAPGAPGAPGSLFKIPVGSQSSGYQQGEQKISGVLDLFFYPGVGHFCVITPGHFSIDVSRRHLAEGDHVLYDLSSSYYEGHTCSLMRFGHSRDGKRGRPIVVYGVMADAAGCPVAVQAYPGNTGDPVTVPDQVEKLRQRFGLKRVVLVGDRGC